MQEFIVAGGREGSGYTSSVLTLLPGASDWVALASLPRTLYRCKASIVGGSFMLTGGYSSTYRSEVTSDVVWWWSKHSIMLTRHWGLFNDFQVLEYQPESDKWTSPGNLQQGRNNHAVLSIGPQQLPCYTGDSFNRLMVICYNSTSETEVLQVNHFTRNVTIKHKCNN